MIFKKNAILCKFKWAMESALCTQTWIDFILNVIALKHRKEFEASLHAAWDPYTEKFTFQLEAKKTGKQRPCTGWVPAYLSGPHIGQRKICNHPLIHFKIKRFIEGSKKNLSAIISQLWRHCWLYPKLSHPHVFFFFFLLGSILSLPCKRRCHLAEL